MDLEKIIKLIKAHIIIIDNTAGYNVNRLLKKYGDYSDKSLGWLLTQNYSIESAVIRRLINFVKEHGVLIPCENNPSRNRMVYTLTDEDKKGDYYLGTNMEKLLEARARGEKTNINDFQNQFTSFELCLDGTYVYPIINGDGKRKDPNKYIKNIIYFLERFEDINHYNKMIEKLSKPLHFENKTIIITDPCYVLEGLDEKDYHKNGITNYLTSDTFYGDWSCTTFNTDTKEVLGEFCADDGMVGVFDLDEVRCNNLFVDSWFEEHKWCATIIPNFSGDVIFHVDEHKEKFNGEEYTERVLTIEGKGNINFLAKQTGF